MTGAVAVSDARMTDFDDGQDARRWGRALIPVLGLHAVAAIVAAHWSGAISPSRPDEQAIAVELAPLPMAQQQAAPAIAAAAAPAPAPMETRPVPVERPVETPVVPVPVVPVPVAVPQRPVMPTVAAAAAATESAASVSEGTAGQGAAQGRPGPATSAAGVPGVAQGAARGGGDAAAIWRGRVLAHLDRHKRYPQAAKLMKREGKVHVSLTLDRRGRVLAVSVERGAGFKPFDAEAVDTVRRADPLPVPPPEVPGNSIPIQVPIGFYLPGSR